MTDLTEAYTFEGRTLIDRDGDKIGKVDELYEDRDSGRPEWALVSTGLLGTKKSFVPLRGATAAGEDVHLPIEKAQVKDAPSIEPDGDLSERDEQRLFEHYGVDYSTAGTTTATEAKASGRGRDVSGPTTDDALEGPAISEEEHEVVLHEERPVAETEVVPKERVRLSTEEQTDEVTVSADVREERIETDDEDW